MDGRSETTVLALTGPPCAGKSTISDILSDIGVPCISTGDAVRSEAGERFDDPSEGDIWSVAEDLRAEHGPAGPTVACREWIEEQSEENDLICVSDLRAQEEADFLREEIGQTLVVRIDADDYQRTQRYVDRELDEDRSVVSTDRIQSLRQELYDRELREMPYPNHDVSIQNDNSVHVDDLWTRLENVVEVLSDG